MLCRCILIVEDEESIRETLQFALQSRGYSVFTASNGKEALDLLPSLNQPTLILLDVMMPVLDGWGFIKGLEEREDLKHNPIVAVTASSAIFPVKETIRKPIDIDILFNTVQRYCGGKKASEESSF